ncbi:unnamed protein product [Lymnaea stagnalis]|uniref:DNA oxidative demethylase ALKBH2 n=1 Tax=Lymnaea stagnalis TaxID=6523 RepID=A0AAV2HE90_LYMST
MPRTPKQGRRKRLLDIQETELEKLKKFKDQRVNNANESINDNSSLGQDNQMENVILKEMIKKPQNYGESITMTNKIKNMEPKSPEADLSLDFLEMPKICRMNIITSENLNLEYTKFYRENEATSLLLLCERDITYNVGDLAKIQMFGKWIDIPRKQVAYGDEGLTYTFSGKTLPANPWPSFLNKVRRQITQATGFTFNFVLVNRYKDGYDYMGEHKDDEKDLCSGYPIASLTCGQERDFVFKHQDSRGTKATRKIDTVSIKLEHGSLLLMKQPTNSFWYHSLPQRKKATGVRVNMTFRKMEPIKCKPYNYKD